MIEAWARGSEHPVFIAQAWRRSADRKRFTTIGRPLLLPVTAISGKAPVETAIPTELNARLQKAFDAGIAQRQALKSKEIQGQSTAAPPAEARH